MNKLKLAGGALIVGLTMASGAGCVAHEAGHAGHGAPSAAVAPQSLALKLPNAALVDQDGRSLRLVSDVVGDKVVLASFVYTSCTTVCPVVSTLFSQVQEKLAGLLDSQVRLVSLSVDPLRDTPPRLKTYADQHGARPGWLWLTGPASEVTETLKGFGTYTANFKDHPVIILIGDGRTGKWTRYYGFQDPERLMARVRDLLAAREQRAAAPVPAIADRLQLVARP